MRKNELYIALGLFCLTFGLYIIAIKGMTDVGESAPTITTYVGLTFLVLAILFSILGWGAYLK